MKERPAKSDSAGFYLHGSSHLEVLARELATAVAGLPLSPLQHHTVLVGTPALARWLDQQITQANGISCQLEYLLPGSWLWQFYRRLQPELPEQDPLGREALPWKIFSLLQTLPGKPAELQPLKQWLAGQPPAGQWQLAEQVADLFDRYQYHRPDWLLQWGKDGKVDQPRVPAWQGWLWKQLHQAHPVNRPSLLAQLPDRLEQAPSTRLPPRLDCFALSGLPAVQMQILHGLSLRLPVHFWQFQPSADYWEDLAGERQWLKAELEETEQFLSRGHPLLMDWGQRIRIQDRQIWQLGSPQHIHDDPRNTASPGTLLQHLQNDIRQALLPEGRVILPRQDDSLQIHRCHTPMRECEVLRDHLLHTLDAQADLQPEDILVMTTDMSTYAPFLQAVFNGSEAPRLPCNLSDLPPLADQPLIQALLQWLDLPTSRLEFSHFWVPLESVSVRSALGLEERDIHSLRQQLQEAGARWGLDGEHRQQLGLPAHGWFSWEMALDRLLLGQVLDEETHLFGMAPIPFRKGNQQRQALAALAHYLQRLRYWRVQLHAPRSAPAWAETLDALLTDLTRPEEVEQDSLLAIRQWLETLTEQGPEPELPLEVVLHLARKQFQQGEQRMRQYSGGITICGLHPLRGVPFRVICLLGMDDEHFPRRDRRLQFDGMRLLPRAGDPQASLEDRSLMLETLMACRQQLWISYSGRDPGTNEPRPAALPVRQLQHAVARRFVFGEENQTINLLQDHPLHGFHPECFHTATPACSQRYLAMARALQEREQQPIVRQWPDSRLPGLEPPEEVEAAELLQFFRHPIRHFLRLRLGIQPDNDSPMQDEEPFELNALQRWQFKDLLLRARYHGHEPDVHALLAEGRLPPPPLCEQLVEYEWSRIRTFWPELPPGRGEPWREQPPRVEIHSEIGGQAVRITGKLPLAADSQGLVMAEAGLPNLGKWAHLHVAHLLACASGWPTRTLWLSESSAGGLQTILPLPPEEARERLQALLQWFVSGQNQALHLLPKAGWAALIDLETGQQRPDRIENALRGSAYARGDLDDPWIARLLHQHDWKPSEDADFSTAIAALWNLLRVPA